MELEIFYDQKFDFSNRKRKYTIKTSPTSLHYLISQMPLPAGSQLLDLGGGDGSAVSLAHADRGVYTTVVDQDIAVDDADGRRAANHEHVRRIAADLDGDWTSVVGGTRFSTVFVLDVLVHLISPDESLEQILSFMMPQCKLYASTCNS